MKVLLTGANGFVGQRIRKDRKDIIICPSLRNADQTAISRLLDQIEYDMILHTAAIADTGFCEQNPEASYQANVQLPVMLAKASGGKKLICFSSDQVYNGSKQKGPYTEDMADPVTVYGRHKLEMEKRVLELCPDAVMLRAEWMYDYESHKTNYLKNILNVTDEVTFSSEQYRGLTYLKEVSEAMEQVLHLPGGIYNFGSETNRSMYEITEEFLRFLGKDCKLIDGMPRHNLWMDTSKAKNMGIRFSEVLDGLKRCVIDH